MPERTETKLPTSLHGPTSRGEAGRYESLKRVLQKHALLDGKNGADVLAAMLQRENFGYGGDKQKSSIRRTEEPQSSLSPATSARFNDNSQTIKMSEERALERVLAFYKVANPAAALGMGARAMGTVMGSRPVQALGNYIGKGTNQMRAAGHMMTAGGAVTGSMAGSLVGGVAGAAGAGEGHRMEGATRGAMVGGAVGGAAGGYAGRQAAPRLLQNADTRAGVRQNMTNAAQNIRLYAPQPKGPVAAPVQPQQQLMLPGT